VASLNENHIMAELAIETLKIAISRHKPEKGIIFHSDQGSDFTSKEFNDFCEGSFVQQSMGRAGCHMLTLQWNDITIHSRMSLPTCFHLRANRKGMMKLINFSILNYIV